MRASAGGSGWDRHFCSASAGGHAAGAAAAHVLDRHTGYDAVPVALVDLEFIISYMMAPSGPW